MSDYETGRPGATLDAMHALEFALSEPATSGEAWQLVMRQGAGKELAGRLLIEAWGEYEPQLVVPACVVM